MSADAARYDAMHLMPRARRGASRRSMIYAIFLRRWSRRTRCARVAPIFEFLVYFALEASMRRMILRIFRASFERHILERKATYRLCALFGGDVFVEEEARAAEGVEFCRATPSFCREFGRRRMAWQISLI